MSTEERWARYVDAHRATALYELDSSPWAPEETEPARDARQRAASAPSTPGRPSSDEGDVIGVCCSGGGIRSAAYNLGALQALWRLGVLRRARYLAAVSGGAYIASALALTTRYSDRMDEAGPFHAGSPEASHLRNRCSYLAAGLGGKVRLVAAVLTGVAANLLFLGTVLWAVGRPLGWAYAFRDGRLRRPACAAADGGCSEHIPVVLPWVAGVILLAGLSCVGWALVRAWVGAHRATRADGHVTARWLRDLGVGQASRRLLSRGALVAGVGIVAVVLLSSPDTVVLEVVIWGGLIGGVALGILGRIGTLPSWVKAVLSGVAVAILAGSAAIALLHWILPALVDVMHPEETANRPTVAATGATGAIAVATIATQVVRLAGRAQTLASTASTGITSFRRLGRGTRRVLLQVLGGVLGPLAVGAAFVLIVQDAAHHRTPTGWEVIGWALAVALALLIYRIGDLVSWSLHPFYKRRLSSAFVVKRTTHGGATVARPIDPSQPLRFTDLAPEQMPVPFPELLVCAAANVSDGGATPPGTAVTSFVFSPSHVGGPLVGYVETDQYEDALDEAAKRHVTVPAAVALSGAALAPAMGKMTRPSFRFLLALGNVRLGVWLPNPRRLSTDRGPCRFLFGGTARPRYLLNEVLGHHSLNGRFLYITDGGHYENLGLVELLRRGCTEIYCFDAAGGEVSAYRTLGEAIALARAELGVEITIDPTVMRPPDSDGMHPASCAVGTITYPSEGGPPRRARLVYVKAGMTKGVPWDVRAYGESDPAFPSHPTGDQLYSGERFEAYRALGESAATAAVRASFRRRRPLRAIARNGRSAAGVNGSRTSRLATTMPTARHG